jgi:hypothetical protein
VGWSGVKKRRSLNFVNLFGLTEIWMKKSQDFISLFSYYIWNQVQILDFKLPGSSKIGVIPEDF